MRLERKFGGKFLLKLNICARPIEDKYCEGKMKRTLERELEVPEIADREAYSIKNARKRSGHVGRTLLCTVRTQEPYTVVTVNTSW